MKKKKNVDDYFIEPISQSGAAVLAVGASFSKLPISFERSKFFHTFRRWAYAFNRPRVASTLLYDLVVVLLKYEANYFVTNWLCISPVKVAYNITVST